MFRRYNEWRVEHAQNLEKAKVEGIAEGIAEGIEKGIVEGKAAAYQEVAAWNARRLESGAKGIPLNEPPSGNGTVTSPKMARHRVPGRK